MTKVISRNRTAGNILNSSSANNSINVHSVQWYTESDACSIGRVIKCSLWSVRIDYGRTMLEGVDFDAHKSIDYFKSMFPMTHLSQMVLLILQELSKINTNTTLLMQSLNYLAFLF